MQTRIQKSTRMPPKYLPIPVPILSPKQLPIPIPSPIPMPMPCRFLKSMFWVLVLKLLQDIISLLFVDPPFAMFGDVSFFFPFVNDFAFRMLFFFVRVSCRSTCYLSFGIALFRHGVRAKLQNMEACLSWNCMFRKYPLRFGIYWSRLISSL